MNIFYEKLKDNIKAVAPIVLIVLVLGFTIAPFEGSLIIKFIIGSSLIILGLSFFLVGVEIGIMPLGSQTGTVLAKSNKLWIVIVAGLVLGFFISIAEPGMIVLANQVDLVTLGRISGTSLLIFVSIGFAVVLSFGLRRIFSAVPLHVMLIVI